MFKLSCENKRIVFSVSVVAIAAYNVLLAFFYGLNGAGDTGSIFAGIAGGLLVGFFILERFI